MALFHYVNRGASYSGEKKPPEGGSFRCERLRSRQSAGSDIDPGLLLVVLYGQPLHVAAMIWPAGAERHYMVDLVTRAGQTMAPSDGAGIFIDKGVALGGVSGCLGVGDCRNGERCNQKSRLDQLHS